MAIRKNRLAARLLWGVVIVLLIYLCWFLFKTMPVLSAYGAKNLCDGIYLQHREEKEIIDTDLSDFPFSLAGYSVNRKDSSVTASVLGLAGRKAIYRSGAGVTLINDLTENETRAHHFFKPPIPYPDLDTVPWPQGNLLKNTIPAGIDTARLQSYLQASLHESLNGKPSQTRAIVVVYDGGIIGEIYAPGYDYKTLMPAWSVTKSITGCLLGILAKNGRINIRQPAPIPEWQGTDKAPITIQDLLQQVSGLNYSENYYVPSEATHMLFNCGNAGQYAVSLPLQYKPGTVFNYSSGNSNILSYVIKNAVDAQFYTSFPYDTLLYKIGMYSTQLEPDASGMYVGSSYCYATARDFARLGLFYYNKGNWLGEQILPGNWVDEGTKAAANNPLQNYGYHIWLNGFTDPQQSKRVYPSAPVDLFYANGYGGQNIFIIPSKKLVMVRLGLRKMDDEKLFETVLSCLPGR